MVPLQGDGWTRPVLDAHHDNKVNDNLRAYDWGKLGTRSGTKTNFGTPNPIGDRRFTTAVPPCRWLQNNSKGTEAVGSVGDDSIGATERAFQHVFSLRYQTPGVIDRFNCTPR